MTPVEHDTLGPEHLALKDFVCREVGRYALNGLNISPGKVRVSDSRMLLVVPTERTSEFPEIKGVAKPLARSVCVDPAGLDKAMRLAGKGSPVHIFNRVIVSEDPAEMEDVKEMKDGKETKVGERLARINLSATDGDVSGTVQARTIEGEFPPDADDKIPADDKRPFKVTFEPEQLKRLASYVLAHGADRACYITFGFDPSNRKACVRIEFQLQSGAKVTGGIMPINI
jgi:hypothetical protein